MEITNEIEKYINSKNENIWNELKLHYKFQLEYNQLEYSWACKIEGNKALIVTPNRKIEIDSFTHELLHIYFDYLGLSKYPDLICSIEGENSMGILPRCAKSPDFEHPPCKSPDFEQRHIK